MLPHKGIWFVQKTSKKTGCTELLWLSLVKTCQMSLHTPPSLSFCVAIKSAHFTLVTFFWRFLHKIIYCSSTRFQQASLISNKFHARKMTPRTCSKVERVYVDLTDTYPAKLLQSFLRLDAYLGPTRSVLLNSKCIGVVHIFRTRLISIFSAWNNNPVPVWHS